MTTTPTARFTGPPPVALSVEAGGILLRVARDVVSATASRQLRSLDTPSLVPGDSPAEVLAPAAAFVTLYRSGELRGCMGCLDFDLPAWEAVMAAAASAALRDPRFPPVTEHEVPSLSIDVSVLGPPVPLTDPSDFRPGVDGLIVTRGGRRGLLLPEVASEHGWDVGDMLEETSLKAGLSIDAWRDKGTHLFVFRTARVSEADAHS